MITLSGGDFGGDTIVLTDENNPLIVMLDATGGQWVYDLSRHPQTETADFIGMAADMEPPPSTPNIYPFTSKDRP